MRLKSMLAAAGFAALATAAVSAPAAAFGWDPSVAPEGYDHQLTIHHRVYKPRYHHVYHSATTGDPYAYRYVQRPWYPYHSSQYWAPAETMRNRYRYSYTGPKYRYQPSWGMGRAEQHDDSGHERKPMK